MTKRAVLYARVSGDDRHREDRNLIGQLDMCREFAQKRGYEVVEELAEDDRGASGAAFELPQLNKVREMALARAFDVLVTRELDRLSRNLAKQLFVEEELKRNRVEIQYALHEYADTPEGNLMKNIRASVAEFERLKIIERMVRGRQLKVKAGSVMVSNRPPFGYNLVERDGKWYLEINEDEAPVIRMIFQWYALGDDEDGPMSIRRIQRQLDELRIPTPADYRTPGSKKRDWGKWSQGTIHYFLTSETYAGVWHFGKNGRRRIDRASLDPDLAVSVPAIISRETWEAAQARMQKNWVESRRNLKYEYLLRGRARCGKCGTPMGALASKDASKKPAAYLYYRCRASMPSRRDYAFTCDARGFRVDAVDAAVWSWVRSLLTEPLALAEGLRALKAQQEKALQPLKQRLAVVEGLLSDNRGKLERLLDLYLTGDFPRAVLDERKARLQIEMQEWEAERSRLLVQLQDDVLTDAEIADLQLFASKIGEGLIDAEADFAFRRFVVETLDVRGTLEVETESGEKVVKVQALIGQSDCRIASRSIHRAVLPG